MAGAQTAQGVDLLGQSNLGGTGQNGEVAVVGNTAVVGRGILAGGGTRSGLYNPGPCADPGITFDVKVVDLTNPASPMVASSIPVPDGVVASDVDALRVNTPAFTGDLAAVALVSCRAPGQFVDRGVAYYDVSDRTSPDFLGRYDADFDTEEPDDPPCGAPPAGNGFRCASSQDKVSLVQRADGTVLSLSTLPFAFASAGTPSGDLRIVDVTNPTAPVQVGAYPNGAQRDVFAPPPGNATGFSANGCDAPFDAGTGPAFLPGGNTALLGFLDHGLVSVGLANPAAPFLLGKSVFPDRGQREIEASFSYVDPAVVGGTPLAMVGEADYVGPSSRLRIDSGPLAGLKFACEAMFTLFDKDNDAQVYKRPGSEVPGGLIYVGRGCNDADYSVFLASPADVAGKIVVRDRNAVASRQTNPGFCSAAAAVKQAQDRGAKGVIINQTSTGAPQAFSFDGDPTGLSIPAYMIDKSDGDALRDALCPDDADNGCGPGGQTITGAMRDTPGDWGALRVFDLSDPAKLTERGVYRSPTSIGLPPDVGVYGVHHAVADGSTAYVAAHSDGVRVVDLSTANPTETGSFVPADTPDPSLNGILPAKAMVTGTDVGPNGTIVITDINSGLYVLRVTPEPGPQNPGPQNPGPSPGGDGGADGPRVRPNLVRPQASAFQTGGRGGASRSAVARMSQSGSRIVVRVRGRMLGNRGRACGGRIKIGTRAGQRRAATRIARMGRTCRYSARYSFPARRLPKRLRPRRRTLVLSILVRYQGNALLRGDLSPPRRVKVRR